MNLSKRRRAIPATVQWLIVVLILAWAARTWWFLSTALSSSTPVPHRANDGTNQNRVNASPDVDLNDDDDDDNDDNDDRRPGRSEVSSSGISEEGENDLETSNGSGDGETGGDKQKAYFISEYKKGDFWISLFHQSKRYVQAISWSDPRIVWYLGGTCAVLSTDLDDRLSVNCDDQPLLKVFTQSKQQRYRSLANKLHKLVKSKGHQCPRLDDFLRKPLQDIDLQHWRYVEPEEILVVHDSISTTSASIVATAREARKALRLSNRIIVERLTANPLLLDGRKMSLRTWLVPLQVNKPVLAYFGIGEVSTATLPYSRLSEKADAHIPVVQKHCLEDLKSLIEVPPLDILVPQLKRIALLVLAALKDSVPSTGIIPNVLTPPICLDFEFDQSSRVWLTEWNTGDRCGPQSGFPQGSTCKSAVRAEHILELNENYLTKKDSFKAKQKFRTLELLADEAQFSDIEDELCDASISPYDRFVHNRQILQDRVKRMVFREDGKPKTSYEMSSDDTGVKCPRCGYLNHQHASFCDLCGNRLATSSSKEVSKASHWAKLSTQVVDDQHDYRAKLTVLFQKHDPKRISNIDVLLDRYRGEEEALLLRLSRQYDALAKHAM